MTQWKAVTGWVVQGDDPEWDLLAQLMDEQLMGWFMWMFEIQRTDGVRIHAYKHRMTRRYLYVDTLARPYVYVPDEDGEGRYRRVESLADELEDVLASWWERGDAEPDEIVSCWEAIDRARRAETRDPRRR